MKKLLIIAAGLLTCSFCSENIVAQTILAQREQTVRSSDNERLQDLIHRYNLEWSAAGYRIMSYSEFKSLKPLPADIMARFHQNFQRYSNKEYGGESTTFVIYKRETGGIWYELQVLEDTAGQAFPNKYTQADGYFK